MSLKTAAVLAFERKLSNSDGVMYAGQWNNRADEQHWQAIQVMEKAVRGTISNRQKKPILADHSKLDAEVKKANLQRVDVAALSEKTDSLKVQFTLRVLSGVEVPSVCDSHEYQKKLQQTISEYMDSDGIKELALRYATNIANARFLWRNRIGAEQIEVKVSRTLDDKVNEWVFNAHDYSIRDFSHQPQELLELAAVIEDGLRGKAYSFLTITAIVKLGEGQEVFPSQELVLDSSNSTKDKKSKILYSVGGDKRHAAMHSQKLGNALRTIDTWYSEAEEFGPISVEPFGSVTSRGRAFRNNKDDFYNLFDGWVTKDKTPEIEQQHYVVATLIRGGVFGEKSE